MRRAYNNTAYTFEKYGKKLTWKLNYNHLNATDKGKLEVLFAFTIGRKKDFYFAEDGSTYSYNVRFLKDSFEFREVAYGVFSISFSFEEVYILRFGAFMGFENKNKNDGVFLPFSLFCLLSRIPNLPQILAFSIFLMATVCR